MNSGTSQPTLALSNKTSSSPHHHQPQRHQPVRSPSDRSSPPRSSSSSPDRVKKPKSPTARRANGGSYPNVSNGGNPSDAETDILSSEEQSAAKGKKRVMKHEHGDAGDASSPSLANKTETSRSNVASRASSVNGDATEKRERKTNGFDKRENGHAKSAVQKKSRLSNDVDSATSRAQSADASTSPLQGSADRARQTHSTEPRKRKFSDSHRPSKLEPPRQRPRLDDASKGSSKPQSKNRLTSSPTPATPGIRAHKRSASTQSSLPTVSSSAQSRKRREASSTTVASDRKEWNSDSSSEEGSSPGHPPIPNLAPPRSNRSAQRALTSPARTMPHPKRADKYGTTPLARACERGNFDAVKTAYEEAPGELDQSDFAGFTPLQKAALGGHADIVQFLLEKGCRRDCFSKDEHDTPLIDAVENGHLEVVKLLLDGGVKPHHQNRRGKRAIDVIDEDDEDANEIKVLIQKAMADYIGSDEDEDDSHDPPVITREDKNRTDLLYLEPNIKNLLEYSLRGDVVAVDHFLSSVKPNNACAVVAARGGHDVVLNLLLASAGEGLEKDPDPAKYEETPLIAAIGRGNLKVIRLLLDQDNFNPTRKTRNGKTYYELAEEMRGPKWQTERDILKDRYEAFIARRKAFQARKKKMQESNKGVGIGSRAPKASESPKELKHKRLKLKKDQTPKEQKRKSRPVLESSDSDGSDDEVRIKQPQKKRKGSMISSKDGLSSPVGIRHPSGGRARSSTDSKIGKESVRLSNAKRSAQQMASSDVEMDEPEPVRPETPESVRESRRAEAAAKAAEEEAQIEEANRLKREAEEFAAKEAARIVEEEAREKARLAEEERLQIEKEKREREERLAALPAALRAAVERGANRPLHFTPSNKDQAAEPGIRLQFLPVHLIPLRDIKQDCEETKSKEQWMMSFQAVGILGLPLEFPEWYSALDKHTITDQQRQIFLRSYDISQLAQEYCWREPGDSGYSRVKAMQELEETKRKFLALQSLDWIRYSDFTEALERPEYKHLATLKITTSTRCGVVEDEGMEDLFDESEPEPASELVPVPKPDAMVEEADKEMVSAGV